MSLSVAKPDIKAKHYNVSTEWGRLFSFSKFSLSFDVSAIQLAKCGFYLNNNDELRCYACGITIKDWQTSYRSPSQVHKTLSPDCLHVNGQFYKESTIYGNKAVFSQVFSADVDLHCTPLFTFSLNDTPKLEINDIQYSIEESSAPTAGDENEQNNHQVPDLTNGSHDRTESSKKPDVNLGINTFSTVPSSQKFNYSNVEGNLSYQNDSFTNNSLPQVTVQPQRLSDSVNQSTVSNLENETRSSISYTQSLGVNVEKPKYQAYAVLINRLKSFREWPMKQSNPPKDIAEAGFFFVGHADYTRCFFCAGGLKNWEPGDDPWIEHARWFPKCTFLRMNKGDSFIRCVQEVIKDAELTESPTGEGLTSENALVSVQESLVTESSGFRDEVEHIWDLPAVVSVVEEGHSKDEIQTALLSLGKKANEISAAELMAQIQDKFEKDSGIGTSSSDATSTRNDNEDDLLDTLSQDDEKRFLLNERETLRKNNACSVCKDKDRECVFLPCGHFTCCTNCAPAMRICPTCGCLIQGVIKTYMS